MATNSSPGPARPTIASPAWEMVAAPAEKLQIKSPVAKSKENPAVKPEFSPLGRPRPDRRWRWSWVPSCSRPCGHQRCRNHTCGIIWRHAEYQVLLSHRHESCPSSIGLLLLICSSGSSLVSCPRACVGFRTVLELTRQRGWGGLQLAADRNLMTRPNLLLSSTIILITRKKKTQKVEEFLLI